MLYPATCVGLRYGPRPARTPRVDFSREYATVRLSLRPKPPRTVGSRPGATSLQRAVPSARASFAPPSSTGLTGRGQRNLHRLSIAYASRLPLRSRLTLIRLALIRNPWPSGEGVSRPLCRYLCLHLLFRGLQQASRPAFAGGGMLPYQSIYWTDSTSSAPDLCPIIIHAGPLD